MAAVVISYTPKTPRIEAVIVAARKAKVLPELLTKSLESFLATPEGLQVEESIKSMASLKSDLIQGES